MKRLLALLLALCLPLAALCGCTRLPEAALDGTPWDPDWKMLSIVMGVEPPGEEYEELETNPMIAASDTFILSWGRGELVPYVNEDGDEISVHEAQLYISLMGCEDAAAAQAAVDAWITGTETDFTVLESETAEFNGQEYTLLTCDYTSDTNPYARGTAAFSVFDRYAICAEYTCLPDYPGDEKQIMTDFLQGCHFSPDAVGKK